MLDPFLNQNPAAKHTSKDFAKGIHAVLISHGHFDHVADAAEIAIANHALLVANYEIASWFEKQGVARTLGMNLGGWGSIPGGRVKLVPAWHSSVLPDGTYGGNPGGFVVDDGQRKVYFAGDTALFSDMQLIGRLGIDAAILPIGDLFTMGIEDSISALEWIRPKRVFPTHYNTWPPIEQDAGHWEARVKASGLAKPVVLKVGASFEV
jgi:L-ascorbate metabolism protein UlaG (beta-lactamase superfamily)